METMCQACGGEQIILSKGRHCKFCHNSSCQVREKSANPSLSNGEHQDCCTSCMEEYVREALRPYDTSLCTSPLISPALSLSSYGSCVSSNGDIPADVNSHISQFSTVNGADVLDTEQKYPTIGFSERLEDQGNVIPFKTVHNQHSDAKTSSSGTKLPMSTKEMCSSDSLALESQGSGSVEHCSSTLGDVRTGDDSDGTENAVDSISSFISNIGVDPLIWIPPEPEDLEDEIESVANNDEDDDDYSDGTKWGQPSSLSFLNEEQGKSHGYKEERKRAMVLAMNGQFKILASRILASEGILPLDGEDVEGWLSIVTSLSWEAAQLIKPDASEGRAMDPGPLVKVKCVASGARHQSQVIRGLVFKKNTAHKHMPTKFKNPRLLLLRGSLGQSAAGLSSFDSMKAEKDYLKSTIIEMIEACHPNVVLVEKTVSRDIQESLLEKGITLVFDLKLHRLERIARCTASQIVSSADILMRPKLKQCDSFYIEKFVEEHNCSGEGGKRPMKTLMFLEGCRKPLGCTILLKGAHSDELKRVKRAIHYIVFAAYHLILETSFFADQRAFFTDMSVLREENGSSIPDSVTCDPEVSKLVVAQAHTVDIPISDGSPEEFVREVTQFKSIHDPDGSSKSPALSVINSCTERDIRDDQFYEEPSNCGSPQSDPSAQQLLPGQLLSAVSASLKRYLGDSLPPISSESISSYFSFKEKDLAGQSTDVPVSFPLDALDHQQEVNEKSNQEKPDDETRKATLVSGPNESIKQCDNDLSNKVQTQNPLDALDHQQEVNEKGNQEKPDDETHKATLVSDLIEPIKQCDNDLSNKVQMQNKDEIDSVLDPQSILVLFSSQCITKQIDCEQSHLSRIKYYGSFDTSLRRFLQDILLNQRHCSLCGEPPESHIYRYTHQNGNLTVLVSRIPRGSILPGESEGKIWMWTRCLKCERESKIPRSTRRVVMSKAASGLSFGKFLELSFSSRSATSRLSRCGHSLNRDSLRFFGIGSKAAMFRYSPVEIYAVCKPPPVLDFTFPNRHNFLKKEAKDVLATGDLFFTEVAVILQKLKPVVSCSLLEKSMSISDSVKEFCEVENMLTREKNEFEASLMNAINHSGQLGKAGNGILDLNWLKQELLFELYIWDRRLHSIVLWATHGDASDGAVVEERFQKESGAISCDKDVEENMSGNGDSIVEAPNQIPLNPVDSSSTTSHQDQIRATLETALGIESAENFCNAIDGKQDPSEVDIVTPMSEEHLISVADQDNSTQSSNIFSRNEDCEEENIPILDYVQEDNSIPVTAVPLICVEGESNLDPQTDINDGEKSSQERHPNVDIVSQGSHNLKLQDPEGWIWVPFSELKNTLRKDLHGGCLQQFEFINCYTPSHLSPLHQVIAHGVGSLHFPIGLGGTVMSIYEDEISSIIACALALSENQNGLTNNTIGKEGDEKGDADNSCTLASDDSLPSSYWSSFGSSDAEGMRPSRSLSSDDMSTSGSDGSLFVDRLIALEELHPEIPVGSAKVAGKSKYTVMCIHAKQFYALRRRCCPSEMAYISSLSRCENWDAQGGKSKAFFAKSMDGRLIIKQIQKTEFDSFLKFAPGYFKHISHSLDSGSQTCLAKILGIYQVRQIKSGKEVKTDLMVMENLLFGRNIFRTYDLKGVVFSRYVLNANDPGKVLLDENFVEDMRVSPIYIGGKTKQLLQRAIWNDTSFLTSINVMDYSLLVGVDRQQRKLVFGIIDYLRQYTWDKQLETWVKASLVVPKNLLPTVVSPKEYKKRFRNFMAKYFLAVPDSWTSEQCSGSCTGGCSSFKLHSAKLPEKSIEAYT